MAVPETAEKSSARAKIWPNKYLWLGLCWELFSTPSIVSRQNIYEDTDDNNYTDTEYTPAAS